MTSVSVFNQMAHLTREERAELECMYDSEIPEGAVQDFLAMRSVPKPVLGERDRKPLTAYVQRKIDNYRNQLLAAFEMIDRFRASGNLRKEVEWSRHADGIRKEIEFYEEALSAPEALKQAAE